MSNILQFILALLVVAGLSLLVCRDRKSIRVRYIVQLLVIEILLAYFFLYSSAGLGFVKALRVCLTSCSVSLAKAPPSSSAISVTIASCSS